ncbi:glycosyl hydrolase [Streptomyces viridochromogenes DSM 40736]|uniref:Glycosyl hydrolase n=2 Tax=Streptomyces viridochromogenes TaxID=1938 RepID=D9X7U5_STRVT|nr:glycosyl hydrolase [Streptomyces viridochromogenes DSM 40736]
MQLPPGEHIFTASSSSKDGPVVAHRTLVLRERPDAPPPDPHDTPADLPGGQEAGEFEDPFARDRYHFERRFGHIGHVPLGARARQIEDIRSLRASRDVLATQPTTSQEDTGTFDRSAPVPGGANWTPVGPGPVLWADDANAGRTLAIAIDPLDGNTVYVGTAGGGLWKSTDRGLTWSPKTDYQRSLAIGTVAIDPGNRNHIIAGTGEYNNIYGGTYYGNGVLRSRDGGTTWTELGTTVFERDEISRILFDPTDTSGQRQFLSSSIGVYESTDDGMNWLSLRPGDASDLVVIPLDASGGVKLVAAFKGFGLWTSTRTSGSWSAWARITASALPAVHDRVELSQRRNNPSTIIAVFGSNGNLAGLARTTDGGTTWSAIPVRLNVTAWYNSDLPGPGHFHSVLVPGADLIATAAPRTYTTAQGGGPGAPVHTHTVSLTAQQIATMAAGGGVVVDSNADATGHTHTFRFNVCRQTGYDLHVAIHPTNPNILFLGEVNLYRSLTGGGTFNPVPGIHSDHHAFAFDPASAATCWDVNDGGVYVSTSTGLTWTSRNRHLATLQYISIAQHSTWDNVMLGGTQDNGTQRYEGLPAWRAVDGSDGGFTAIDPQNPTRMYHQYFFTYILRSDDAGRTWLLKNKGIDSGAGFYSPFAFDPGDPNICYFGGRELWRSTDNADNWSAVTSGIQTAITAIAVHSDNRTIYVGTNTGRVYRLLRTGATWNPADVTRTDVTAPMPSSSISDLAVDNTGTVWATLGSVLQSEGGGEFTNDHVWRLGPNDAQWTPRSNGLAQANPVNTIVIDSNNNNRLFCGADVGVFRTENAGQNWYPWDQGLPNVPVFHLAVHGPRRLLRAATHGRSVWERPIDVTTAPMADLYLRDNMLDSGRGYPSPTGVPDPFDPAGSNRLWWWQSPDILVDAPQPDYQTASPVSDYVALSRLQHRSIQRGRINRVYVQVHNRGAAAATNVQVRAFIADASAGLPALPADFWTNGKPFTGDPTATSWSPVGPTRTIGQLKPAEPSVIAWDYNAPLSASEHSCILAVTTCAQDPLNGAGILDVSTLVPNRKHVTLKNLQVVGVTEGAPTPDDAFVLLLNNPAYTDRQFTLVVHWAGLPEGTRLFTVFEEEENGQGPRPGEGVRPIDDGPQVLPARFTDRRGQVRNFDFRHAYELFAADDHQNRLSDVRIPLHHSRAVALNVQVPEGMDESGQGQLHIVQQEGEHIVGGAAYIVRAADHHAAGVGYVGEDREAGDTV